MTKYHMGLMGVLNLLMASSRSHNYSCHALVIMTNSRHRHKMIHSIPKNNNGDNIRFDRIQNINTRCYAKSKQNDNSESSEVFLNDGLTLTLATVDTTNTGTQIDPVLDMHSTELIIQKSRFIAYAVHCSSYSQAKYYLTNIHKVHPKARHVCYGLRYTTGQGVLSERGSDDGEPTGTACAPILNALRGTDLSDTLCVVVRYFGGIKLGAGGLIRAYGGSARQTLQDAEKRVCVPQRRVCLRMPAMFSGTIYEIVRKVDENGVVEIDETTGGYDENGNFLAVIQCDARCIDECIELMRDASRGQVETIPLNEEEEEDS